MQFVADFHIHSHFSRATSRDLTFEQLHKWAQLKGVQVVGTGDLTHPGWLKEMQTKLVPADEGLFQLNTADANVMQREVVPACQQPVRFILSGEISTIYKKQDRVRKIHHVVFLPSFEAVAKFQARLEKIGNIRSDGRPILGLDSRDLLEIVLETDPQAYLIPAHIWTPWFSLFGSKSGFDVLEDCFADLTPHIFALETGLSSDPPMNWRWSALDRYTLISNSDAHSPQKLAREANLFDTACTYPAIFAALQTRNPQTFRGTLEFFPEEGKYHADGHRKCDICWQPQTTLQHHGICPTCGKPVTVGVMHRVELLADRPVGGKPADVPPFRSLIPLPEILAEVLGTGVASKRVTQGYETLLAQLGPELPILQDVPLPEIARVGGDLLAEGIRRMRQGEVIANAGYDGENGVITLFAPGERHNFGEQFGLLVAPPKPRPSRTSRTQTQVVPAKAAVKAHVTPNDQRADASDNLNLQQQAAVTCVDRPLLIVAGPGTGKTRTLTQRIAYLVTAQGVPPEQILAITFTNKAAAEMQRRLQRALGEPVAARLTVKTFHALGAMILRECGDTIDLTPYFAICRETDQQLLLKHAFPEWREQERTATLEAIAQAKAALLLPDAPTLAITYQNQPEFLRAYRDYQAALQAAQMVDFEDLLLLTIRVFETQPEVLQRYQQRFRWISVDEYQDVNFAQHRFLRLLKTPAVNLCVIGDPDQAIYGFRGADRQYFQQFQADFPDAQTICLTQNYRSSQTILAAAQQVIAKNPDRLAFDIWSDFVSQTKLTTYHAPTYKAEAEYVVHEIEKLIGGTTHFSLDSGRVASHDDGTRAFSDVAVLYRLGAQSQPLFEAFERSGIPYQIVGQMALCDYKDIQEILAYAWLLYQPEAAVYWEKISPPRAAAETFLAELRRTVDGQLVTTVIQRIVTHLTRYESAVDAAVEKRAERIQRLLLRATLFGANLAAFLESTALHSATDEYDPRAGRVTLMTLHASKGLEFPVVFIVGCEETLLPYERAGQPTDVAEERRLFYVGMTRAREQLILTSAQTRFLFGTMRQNPPSRFLADIEQALQEVTARQRRQPAPGQPADPQIPLF